MSFSNDDMKQLKGLFSKLIRGFTYVSDETKHRVSEFWEDVEPIVGKANKHFRFSGDCEEFAMTSMRHVRELGFNARLVFCYVGKEGHCICEVLSKDGKASVMFDNRYNKPMIRADMKNYSYLAVSPINPVKGETRKWSMVA